MPYTRRLASAYASFPLRIKLPPRDWTSCEGGSNHGGGWPEQCLTKGYRNCHRGQTSGEPTFFFRRTARIKCMTVISVIVGSTREGRFSEKPAKWILQHL